jgi:hypothetical protein
MIPENMNLIKPTTSNNVQQPLFQNPSLPFRPWEAVTSFRVKEVEM